MFVKLFQNKVKMIVCIVGAGRVVSFEPKSKVRDEDQADLVSLTHEDKVDKSESV